MNNSQEITGEILLERARAMVPALRGRARETEQNARLPDATINEAAEAGLFQAFVPKRYGGYEVDFQYGPRVTRELAHGCAASAWILSFFVQHNWQAGLCADDLQLKLWAARPYVLAPAHIIPSGTAVPVDGGYQLSGRWQWTSGIQHGDWFFAAAVVPGGDGPRPDTRYFVVPIEQVTIDGTWEVSGLAGTGSNTVVIKDIFVADDMQVSFNDMLDGTAPGRTTQTPYLWDVPMVLVLMYNSLTAISVGVAEAAYQILIDIVQEREIKYGGGAALKNSAVHMRAGRCKMTLATIQNLFDSNLAKIEDRTRSGEPLSEFERLELMAQATWIIHASRWLIDDICEGAGSSFNFLSHPLQRMRRDMNVLGTHGIANYDRSTENYGKVLLGHDIPPDALR
jgi:3-hydroxy-9,10-secoandrosta-1,3,5(10)-triene-9,17-dione monooxygenase